jgi:hypothetical protein
MLLFHWTLVTTCEVRKCTAFLKYVQCMFEDLETCLHVHHWLATNDFNYRDGFTYRLWWISAYFFIGIKVVLQLPSKDIVGNDVTSCIFSKLDYFIEIWKCPHFWAAPGFHLLRLSLLMILGQWYVCLCVCLCMHTSVCNTCSVTVDYFPCSLWKFFEYALFPTYWLYPLFRYS